MPQTTLYRKDGAEAGTVELPESLFAAPINEDVIHQAVTAQLAGRHLGTHKTKKRGEVSGGGVVFGPQPRSYAQRLPRQMKRLALRGALTSKFDDGAVRVVEDLELDEIRTRELIGYLDALHARGRVLVVAPARDQKLELSARNIPTVEVILAGSLNVVDVLEADTLLITAPALQTMTEVFA